MLQRLRLQAVEEEAKAIEEKLATSLRSKYAWNTQWHVISGRKTMCIDVNLRSCCEPDRPATISAAPKPSMSPDVRTVCTRPSDSVGKWLGVQRRVASWSAMGVELKSSEASSRLATGAIVEDGLPFSHLVVLGA